MIGDSKEKMQDDDEEVKKGNGKEEQDMKLNKEPRIKEENESRVEPGNITFPDNSSILKLPLPFPQQFQKKKLILNSPSFLRFSRKFTLI